MSQPATRVGTQLPGMGSVSASSEWKNVLSGRLLEGGDSGARLGEPLSLEKQTEDGNELL